MMIWILGLVSAQIFELQQKTKRAFEEDILHLEGLGDIYANLTLYSDENFENEVGEGGYFPNNVDRFYFDVKTLSGLENIKVKDCKARIWPDPDAETEMPDHPYMVHFIRHHCPNTHDNFDVTFLEPAPRHQQRFSIKRFRFPHPSHDHIRIACTVSLCLPGDVECGICKHPGFVKREEAQHNNWNIRDEVRNLIGMNFKVKLF